MKDTLSVEMSFAGAQPHVAHKTHRRPHYVEGRLEA